MVLALYLTRYFVLLVEIPSLLITVIRRFRKIAKKKKSDSVVTSVSLSDRRIFMKFDI